MKSILKTALIALTGLVLVSGGAYAEKLILEGSTTVLPIAQAGAEAFMAKNSDISVTVRGGGSGVGIASLLDSTCDICDSSRSIKAAEIQKALSKGVDPKGSVIAMDGIAVILNPGNGVKNLTKKQIKDIYTGNISDWSKVGGDAGKIVVVSRDTASGTYEAFGALAIDGAKVRGDALLQASNQAVATTVGTTPGGIGYIGLGYLTEKVKAVTVNGIECKKENVLNNSYPLSRPLYMYTNGKPQGAGKKFIDFILSNEGQKIVEEAGFVALQK